VLKAGMRVLRDDDGARKAVALTEGLRALHCLRAMARQHHPEQPAPLPSLMSSDYGVTKHPDVQVLFEYCAAFMPQFLPMMVRLGTLAPLKPCALLLPDTVLLRTILVE
jgi:hypothetical protein